MGFMLVETLDHLTLVKELEFQKRNISSLKIKSSYNIAESYLHYLL